MSESRKDTFSYSYVSSSSNGAQSSDVNKSVESKLTYPDQQIPNRLDQIREQKKHLFIEEGKMIEKGLQSDDPDILMKATKHWNDVQNRVDSGIKSVIIDPNEFKDSLGYKNKGSAMSYGILRRMSHTPLVRAVVTTRQAQVSRHSAPQSNKFEPGFIIRKKQKFFAEEEAEITSKDREKMDYIARFLINGGEDGNAWDGDTFDTFLKKLVEDSLTMDQATFEVVRNNFGEPVEFLATDAATFRIADTYDQEGNENQLNREEVKGYLPKYVQLIDGSIVREYYPWELCFGIRNSSTNIHTNGYGRSELETLIQIVTWMLYSDTYNGNFFSQGAAPKGFLKVAGNVNSTRIQEFRQQWQSMVAGVMNSWKVPIIESEKMEWIDLQTKNTDMQFAQWQEYLLKVVCAVYKISPEELGFAVSSGGASGGGGLGDGGGSGNDSKVKFSIDKGLKPLMKNIEFWINKWIINALDDEFEFAFVGLDIESEKDLVELNIKRASTYMGLKEARIKDGLSPEIDEDDMILNPIWLQKQQADQMAGDQAESTEVAEEEGGSVWDDLDEADEAEKSMVWDSLSDKEQSDNGGNPFMFELNEFMKGLMDD